VYILSNFGGSVAATRTDRKLYSSVSVGGKRADRCFVREFRSIGEMATTSRWVPETPRPGHLWTTQDLDLYRFDRHITQYLSAIRTACAGVLPTFVTVGSTVGSYLLFS